MNTRVTERGLSRLAVMARKKLLDEIAEGLMKLVSQVPSSGEKASESPSERAKSLVLQASAKSALVSGTLALPPGPPGMLTILPDLFAIWRIQRQLVSDIAAAYGKSSQLGPREMIYCLFRHAAGQAVRDVVVRLGERVLVRRMTLRLIRGTLQRIGVEISERAAGRAISRWLPIIGAVGIGGYAFYDTAQVGNTATIFFQKELMREENPGR
jgi:hypothetical protein